MGAVNLLESFCVVIAGLELCFRKMKMAAVLYMQGA